MTGSERALPVPGPAPAWMLGHACQVPHGDAWLTSVERHAQLRFVLPKRRAEWRLGRWTAKTAVCDWVHAAGAGDGPAAERDAISIVARGPDDGYPLVEGACPPTPRLSLSHRGRLAVAAVAPGRTALGCDLERVEPRRRGFASDWFTPGEQRAIACAPSARREVVVTLTWSAKEAALKAVGVGLRVDTRSVETKVHVPDGHHGSWGRVTARVAEGPLLTGWWRPLLGYVLVVVAGDDALARPPRRLWTPALEPAGPTPGPAGGERNYGARACRTSAAGRYDDTPLHIEEHIIEEPTEEMH